MTDNEIIKALECCSEEDKCKECPYYNKGNFKCLNYKFFKDLLDLVNRLQAENERLNKEVDRLSQVVLYNDSVTEMEVEEAKAEAYKEFAERYKALLETELAWCECVDEITKPLDILLKEKVGEDK